MSDDWDFYFCSVDNKPASIFVDLGIAKEAPMAEYSVMAYVRTHMQAPRDDGLSSQVEFETLKSLEDALESLRGDGTALYVGRSTSNGCRDLYFYARTAEGWAERVADVMKAFPSYEFEYGTRSDPDWNAYFRFLYPSDEDRERIQNRRTCEALERNGDRLEKERPIEHWVYFPDSDSRQKFSSHAATLGYTTVALIEPESDQNSYGIRLSCIGVPSIANIDDLTIPLFRAARDYGGEYDGWETEVVR
ncbi:MULTISPECIES: DUF695 domain-containing protein [Methylocaldum]|jgi:uncharacterized protein (TIGR01619 family)|uniref:DUF695 domain-containing protein n=1 Tax=Methylocaldum sp. 14B TaxID=1912213 RepID=UPI00098BA247|nr:DUF695 domain-containing protein [Methylocaldum sp. 14B]MVF25033.1 DUF695 domain-containing protein [Methylocaldum sp. BRCS4]